MVYLQATIELKAEGVPRFMEAIAKIVPILGKEGMRLALAFMQRTGRLNTVIDVWELEDMNHLDRALGVLAAHPDFPAIKAALDASVERETLVFGNKLPYAP